MTPIVVSEIEESICCHVIDPDYPNMCCLKHVIPKEDTLQENGQYILNINGHVTKVKKDLNHRCTSIFN